jgi:tRNA (guanine37-N1)-methyltransferase
MFCGIGPLAVKAAASNKKIKVICNDLNPECYQYLNQNIELNKVKNLVYPFNMDAREFVKYVVNLSNTDPITDSPIPANFLRFDHVYMNLPVDAIEFLDVFIGLFDKANP